MKIFLENVNLNSSSGPNSFARKMLPYISDHGCVISNLQEADIALCFIESTIGKISIPRVQRLDGIYFNTSQDFNLLNSNIKKTFLDSQGIIFQSNFNKELITKWYGKPDNFTVIHNGADLKSINNTSTMKNTKYDNIWCCAASWRPHKRLKENIDYFLQHKGNNDLLIIAGDVPEDQKKIDKSIAYFGNLNQTQLYSLYKASKYFLHLAWLDHCPNVVVDARACGCHIICSSAGGTKEIAGPDATIIEESTTTTVEIQEYEEGITAAAAADNNINNNQKEKKFNNDVSVLHNSEIINNPMYKNLAATIQKKSVL